MGNGPTKPALTQEQEDIKHLGDRFPFGDDELVRLYRCYQAIEPSPAKRGSFLSECAVYCTRLPPSEPDPDGSLLKALQEERLLLMKAVESKILPKGFGNRLEEVVFLRPQDTAQQSKGNTEEQDDYTRLARLEKFFDGAATCSRRGGRATLGTVFQCCVNGIDHPLDTRDLVHTDGNEIVADVNTVLDLTYRLALASAFLSAGEDMGDFIPSPEASKHKVMEALSRSTVEHVKKKKLRENPYGGTNEEDPNLKQGLVTKMDFLEWSESNAPLLSSTLPTFMHFVFFPDRPYPPSRTPFVFPRIPSESAFFNDPSSPLLFTFSSMSSSLAGEWHRLYTSTSDGLSFNRLQNALLGYSGPTLLVTQATNDGIFGAFTASSWKESKDFYGNSDCFLFQVLPCLSVYRPRGGGANYMYCNSEARSRGYDGLAHGIGFGGTTDEPRFFISESFDGCIASSQDLTFETGPLLPRHEESDIRSKYFEIDNLEVWGVGGDAVVSLALESRSRQREITAAGIQKARKVDKAAFLDDFRGGIIESKAFKHREQIRGRADVEIDEKHTKSYAYEK